MKKEDLIRIIKEGIRFEGAVPIFMQHLSHIVTQTTLADQYIQKIKKLLEYLSSESSRHKNELETLLEKIQAEERDVY